MKDNRFRTCFRYYPGNVVTNWIIPDILIEIFTDDYSQWKFSSRQYIKKEQEKSLDTIFLINSSYKISFRLG